MNQPPSSEPVAPSGHSGAAEPQKPGDPEAEQLRVQLQLGDLSGLRAYLARTRSECDWQDRIFMLALLVPAIRKEILDFACDVEPEAADLRLLRGIYFSALAMKMRGGGTCEEVREGGFRDAASCIKAALEDMEKTNRLDPDDPTLHSYILRPLTIFGELIPVMERNFVRTVQLAPGLVPAHYAIVTALSKRWHGSHEKSLEFARSALAKAEPGSDMAVCLFWAHNLVKSHFTTFDKKPADTRAYANNSGVRAELAAAFDQWTHPPYEPRRSSTGYLHQAAAWFFQVQDRERLQRALALTGNTFSSAPWSELGKASAIFAMAKHYANGTKPEMPAGKDPMEECYSSIVSGSEYIKRGRLKEAEISLASALQYAKSATPEESTYLVPLVLFHISLLRGKQERGEDAKTFNRMAIEQLDARPDLAPLSRFAQLMAKALGQLNDHRRAIPFWEHAIRTADDTTKSADLGEMLHRLGESYSFVGLRDYATVPFRAALKIFRAYPEDPRLPAVLVGLGNSLRKSCPDEAEALYRETVQLYSSKLQYQSATPAMVNLGILCSEQGRYEESLEYYQGVLRIREQTAGTPPARIAGVLNSIANTYRRMDKYAEAHKALDRAFRILPAGETLQGEAYGTRGRIFLAAGEDAKAAEWLRRSRAEREKQASPNLDSITEDLEGEIAALERLGRDRETAVACEALASVRARLQAVQRADESLCVIKAPEENAVYVELAFGNRPHNPEAAGKIGALAKRLSEAIRNQDAGRYSGWLAVPENTTLIFYGSDAERLFAVIEPLLAVDSLCIGARAIVQQDGAHRAIAVGRPQARVN